MLTRTSILSITVLFASIFLMSCTNTQNGDSAMSDSQMAAQMDDDVITAEDQQELTPQQVIDDLKAGNERFVNSNLTNYDYMAQVEKTASGQFPEAVVIACIDSRVPVEAIFDRGIGDIFVARVAGNFVNEDILGSTEFGTAVAGSKAVIVMGHEHCGAVKSAIDDVEMGNITAMLSKIKPAVDITEEQYEGEDETSSNTEFVTEVVNNNVRYTIEQMRERSSIIADLERNGDVVIAGAFYDLDTGVVTFLD